jgi:hypothetical protein
LGGACVCHLGKATRSAYPDSGSGSDCWPAAAAMAAPAMAVRCRSMLEQCDKASPSGTLGARCIELSSSCVGL